MIWTTYFSERLSPDCNKLVADFVSKGVWDELGQLEKYCALAIIHNEKLIAGVVYHNYHPDNGIVEMSAYSDSKRWLTKKTIRDIFDLPFNKLNCQMVVMRVSEFNDDMIGIARRFGFSEVYIPRLRSRKEGEYIFTYTDDQWNSSAYNESAA